MPFSRPHRRPDITNPSRQTTQAQSEIAKEQQAQSTQAAAYSKAQANAQAYVEESAIVPTSAPGRAAIVQVCAEWNMRLVIWPPL